jgi:hypothetical protein
MTKLLGLFVGLCLSAANAQSLELAGKYQGYFFHPQFDEITCEEIGGQWVLTENLSSKCRLSTSDFISISETKESNVFNIKTDVSSASGRVCSINTNAQLIGKQLHFAIDDVQDTACKGVLTFGEDAVTLSFSAACNDKFFHCKEVVGNSFHALKN